MGKRGRKPKAERKGYFYEEQEQAVIDYLNTYDDSIREKIFNETLKPAFTKMVESIIRRYNLYVPDEEFQETFDDTMSFLLTKIEHFNTGDSETGITDYIRSVMTNFKNDKETPASKKAKKILNVINKTIDGYNVDVIASGMKNGKFVKLKYNLFHANYMYCRIY